MSRTINRTLSWLARTVLVVLAIEIAPASSLAADGLAVTQLDRQTEVQFEMEILPILRRNCLPCHNRTDAESELVLETPAAILAGGSLGPAAVSGKSADSLMFQLAAHLEEPFMPPADNQVGAKNLTPDELGLLKLWIDQGARGDVTRGAPPLLWQQLPSRVNPIYAVRVSPHGRYAAASRANQIFLYHLGSKKLLGRLSDPALETSGVYARPGIAHLDLVQSLAFSPDGNWLASGGFRTVKLWRREFSIRRFPLEQTDHQVSALAATPDCKTVALGTAEGAIMLLDVAAQKATQILAGHQASVTSLAFAANAKQLATSARDGTVRVWDLAQGHQTHKIDVPQLALALAWVGTPERLAVGGDDHTIRIWSMPPSNPPAELKGHQSAVTALAPMSPSGQLVSGSQDGSVRLWRVDNGEQVRQLDHGGPVTAVAATGDGQRIASIGNNRTTKLWNATDGQLVATMQGNDEANRAVEDARRAVELAKRHVSNAKEDLDAANKQKTDEENNAKKAEQNLMEAKKAFAQKKEAAEKTSGEKQAAEKALEAARAELAVREAAKKQADEQLKQAAEDALEALTTDVGFGRLEIALGGLHFRFGLLCVLGEAF